MKDRYFDDILAKAMRFCAYQERCIHDLKLKNKIWTLNEADFNALIANLQENNFLNEKRFVEMYVHGKFFQKHWGKIKIRHMLLSKNISGQTIERELSRISSKTYTKCIKELLLKKSGLLDKSDPDRKVKLFKFLQAKGFETDLVYELLGKFSQ